MDRQIVYPGQILPETTLLQMAKDAMIGSAKLAAAMLGTSTIANGFAVTPTGPASLQVVVAPGEIYALANIDSLAFSTLPADTTHSILKQGILLDGVTLSCPAPTTTGQSINYLVQATYQDQDSTPVLLPYYNSANPALPFSGMGNNGLTQNTSRKGVAIVQVKAGASAATGSQVTPAPDSGYVGLYVVTVAFGQTVINSGSIAQFSGAPLLPSGIIQSIQSGNTTYAQDVGAANAYAATYSPAVTISDSLVLRFKAANNNTGASTFSPNGITPAPIIGGNHSALQGGEIVVSGDVWVQWNSSIGGGSWVLQESSGGGLQVAPASKRQHAVTANQVQGQTLTAYTAGGTSPAFTLTPVPALTTYSTNHRFQVSFSAAGGATPTINVSGLGAVNLKQYNSSAGKIPAAISAGQTSDIFYDGTDFVLLDQLPNSTGVTQAQFDNSLNLATTAWVRGVGKRYSSIAVATTTYTVTVANAGGLVLGNAASLFNAVLPSAAALPPGETITIYCYGAGGMQVYVAGSDTINFPPSIVTDFLVVQGMSITLASNGINAWYVTSQNAVGAKPSQFDSSGKYATTSFVQGVGLQFSGTFALSANTTLTAATHAGGLIVASSASLITVTLPAASTMPSKTTIKLFSYAAGGMTIAAAGSDSIYLPATNTTFAVPIGAWITLASNGTNGWYAIDMSGAGVGQTYVNMTGLRVSGTTYPNPSGKQITVIVNLTSGTGGSAATATVGSNVVVENSQGTGTTRFSISFQVPAAATYVFNAGSATVVSVWEYK